MKTVYFQNFNPIRFFAALLVIVHHVEQIKMEFHFPNHFYGSIALIGKLGVVLFFVLSGFLITYLILTEEKETGNISIKDFYMRRVLRIWPLYYLILVLAFFILPNIDFFQIPSLSLNHFSLKLVFFFLLMPNIIHALGAGVAYANQTWSIGTEEQFYIIWPIIMKFSKNKIRSILYVLFGYLVIKLIFIEFKSNFTIVANLSKIWSLFCIDCMSIGAIFAYIRFVENNVLKKYFTNYFVQVFSILGVVLLIFLDTRFGLFTYDVYGLIFGVILFNLSYKSTSLFNINSKSLDYLGKISYGLYMYHPIVIIIALKLLIDLKIYNGITLYILTILLSILFSHMSYLFFEKRFLKLKSKYSKIVSGDNSLST